MTSVSRGRPQASSQETLADAASELFLEQGYETTTVNDITQRAGVSRSTFFNYFDGKAATIWFALDTYLRRASNAPVLANIAAELGTAPLGTLALAITNAEAMGVDSELTTGRALRQAELARLIGADLHTGRDALAAETMAAAHAAAVFSAVWTWAVRGSGTHRLDTLITEALASTIAREAAPSVDADCATPTVLRATVIGVGAIGGRVIEELAASHIEGVTLAGVITRREDALDDLKAAHPDADFGTDFGADIDRALAESDLIIECGGIPALRSYGPAVIAAGRTLLTVSIGALADPEMRAALTAGPGILKLSHGAIGGLDIVAAASRSTGIPNGISAASITSTKKAKALVQPWMSEAEAEHLRTTPEAFELFSGTVTEAIALFPGSLNIACALAHASGLWDETFVKLVADPAAERTHHRIEASGAAGDYSFTITNKVSPITPTSSMIVAESVLSGVESLAGNTGTFA